jgi:hypothetical protein
MRLRTCFAVFLLFLTLAFDTSAESQKEMIVRMNIQIGESDVHLIRASIHSGKVQERRLSIEHRTEPFSFRVMSNKDEILFEDTIQDPRVLFFDEPDLTGNLHGGMIRNKKGVATVVFPYFQNSRSVDFFHRILGHQEEDAFQLQRLESFGSIEIQAINASIRAEKRSTAVPPVNIQKTGKAENRIDMVFLAEGYTAAQKATFLATVRRVVASWKLISPWSQYFRLLNIYAVPLVSSESGADKPGVNKNTALDSVYGCFQIPRLICVDTDKATAAAAEAVPLFDFAIVVVNDSEYGGSGGIVSVFSTNQDAQQIFFHEIAHTYASLADEYTAANPNPPPFTEQLYPNVSKIKNRNTIKWKAWILPTTPVPTPATLQDAIGVFNGAFFHPTKYVRPKADCLMRTLGRPLDAVCAEAHILKAWERVSFIDIPTPAAANIVLPRSSSQPFKVKPAPIPLIRLQFEWFVDGRLQTSKIASFTLPANQLAAGNHQVMVKITDKTTLVKTDPRKLRTDSFTWNVTIQ